jgi:hypothetical protein
LRLAAAMGARPAQTGSRREDDRTRVGAVEHRELLPERDCRLMDVAADDELGSRGGEPVEDGVTVGQRPLARGAPRRACEMVMARDDAQGARRRRAELGCGSFDSLPDEPSRLVTPGARGVQTHYDQRVGAVGRVGRADEPLPLGPRTGETGRERVGEVVVARDGETGDADTLERVPGRLELGPPTAMGEISRRQQHLRLQFRHELGQRGGEAGRLAPASMEIRDVKRAGHDPGEAIHSAAMSEGPEIFDDLYLGLRAGGAMRKRRRGEELTVEEAEALGRWHRLSIWRKSVAIGAFAVGTFGLGFTLGGLVFGRWRKA